MYKKVLFIDDDPISAFLNKKALLRINRALDIRIITDGEEALDFLKTGFVSDLIFLDLNMPGMSGMEFLEEFKAANFKGSIVALTSMAPRKERMEKLMLAGCNDILVKPLTEEMILEILNK